MEIGASGERLHKYNVLRIGKLVFGYYLKFGAWNFHITFDNA
jgi:hypothetical protein